MPLVRFEVKNEYGLGDPDLYRGDGKRDEPKAVLDGVAVAGLVGILRQLGDLAQFAADIFQDLHDQVMTTAARGQKMLTRIQHIESSLPSLEQAVQVPRSYIHFSYISGVEWHPNVRIDENQLICSDLPQFMIDCYEECSEPPRLYLLDKFDSSGAGACLKRYSDPSYFKRALSSSDPIKAEKVKRKKKKRVSQLRSARLHHAVLSTRESNSTQFASPSTDRLSFSVDNASISETRSKSEFLRESTFSDSEIRPDYTEQFSDTPSTVPYVSDCIDAYVPTLHNEPNEECRDDDSHSALLQQPSALSSSSVTWDEKIEIVKSANADELVDRVQDLPRRFETSNLCSQTARLGPTVNQEDIVFELAKVPVPNETDNFTGANNILESEAEMEDSECQTKWEVNSPSNLNHGDVETRSYMLNETSPAHSRPSPSSNYLNNYAGPKFSTVVPSEGFDHDQSTDSSCHTPTRGSPVTNGHPEISIPYVTATSSSELLNDGVFDPESSCHTSTCGSPVTNGHPEISIPYVTATSSSELLNDGVFDPKSSKVSDQDLLVDRTNNQMSSSQSCLDTSSLPSVQIWTNGGILGLEPSKPPSGAVSVCSAVGKGTSDGVVSIKNSEESIGGPLLGNLEQKPEVLSGKTNTYAHTSGADDRQTDVTPESGLTVVSNNTESFPRRNDKKLFDNPTSFSGLANKFLSDSLQKKVLLAQVSVSKPSQLLNTDFRKLGEILLQTDHKDLSKGAISNSLCSPETEENTKVGSSDKPSFHSLYSESSSPPLEHMKISFHPMNSLEASKLKLEFSGGNLSKAVGDETFPSYFQLISGPSTTMMDSGFESDDDTFCRSSAYSSEDFLSPHSNSNSEMWGEDETCASEKPNLSSNSFRTSSPTSSVCSSMKFEPTDISRISSGLKCLEVDCEPVFFQSDSINEFSVNSELYAKKQQQESGEPLSSSTVDDMSHSPFEPPLPLPLPPLQWRVVKQSSASFEDYIPSCGEVFENLHEETQCFTTQNQREQVAPRPPFNVEATAHHKKTTHDQQKLIGQKGQNPNSDCTESNEREDLLHQIRNMSFNLKRTLPVKPSQTEGPTSNASVIAIIEKADILRQAFSGSNERRDDDSWE